MWHRRKITTPRHLQTSHCRSEDSARLCPPPHQHPCASFRTDVAEQHPTCGHISLPLRGLTFRGFGVCLRGTGRRKKPRKQAARVCKLLGGAQSPPGAGGEGGQDPFPSPARTAENTTQRKEFNPCEFTTKGPNPPPTPVLEISEDSREQGAKTGTRKRTH